MISQIIMKISKIYTISACQSKGIRSNLNMVWPFFQILVSPFFIFCLCSSSSNSCTKSCLIYFKYDNLTKRTTIIAIKLTIINLSINYSHPLCFIFLIWYVWIRILIFHSLDNHCHKANGIYCNKP